MNEPSKSLSLREQELLNLAAQGLTDAGIAHQLGISTSTVNTYWIRIRSKMGAHSRSKLISDYLKSDSERLMQELQEENERLHRVIEGLEQSSGARHRGLFNVGSGSSEAVVVVGVGGEITGVTQTACVLFGYEADEMLGMSVDMLVPEDLRHGHVRDRDSYWSAPTPRQMGHSVTPAVRKDGTTFPALISLALLQSTQGTFVNTVVRDITPQVKVAHDQILAKDPNRREA